MGMSRATSRRAFTLVELLVGVIECAMVAGATAASISQLARLRSTSAARRQAYARCDVVLVPSRAESFGRVVAEAMLNAIPVVAADIPALREVLGGDAGVLFRPGDASDAARAVSQLVADPALRKRLGQAGQRRAAQYAPADVAGRFRALYLNAGGIRRPPR